MSSNKQRRLFYRFGVEATNKSTPLSLFSLLISFQLLHVVVESGTANGLYASTISHKRITLIEKHVI